MAIVLLVLLRFTTSGYPVVIFSLYNFVDLYMIEVDYISIPLGHTQEVLQYMLWVLIYIKFISNIYLVLLKWLTLLLFFFHLCSQFLLIVYFWHKMKKNTTHYVLDTTIHMWTQTTQIRHDPSYKQLEVKREHCFYAEINVTDIITLSSECKYT
jgi:hypothetical protein